jgi:hypothetical protein
MEDGFCGSGGVQPAIYAEGMLRIGKKEKVLYGAD